MKAHFILYVSDQERSADFYSAVLDQSPILTVPGMTEFRLEDSAILGLMPEDGITRLLGEALKQQAGDRGGPRAELYLVVEKPAEFHARAIAHGARELSPLLLRDWHHTVAYSLDPDGYVLAFASAADPA